MGIEWKETCHLSWSRKDKMFTRDQLNIERSLNLVNAVYKQTIPTVPKVSLPIRQSKLRLTLETVSRDVQSINEKGKNLEGESREKTDKELELREIDNKNFQAIMAPKVADLIGKHNIYIQYKFKMDEVDEAKGEAKLIQYTVLIHRKSSMFGKNGNKARMV